MRKIEKIINIDPLLKKAKLGQKEAQFELGQQNEDTGVLGSHPSKALFWYRKAARQGHAAACNCIGYYYNHGIGVKKNLKKANFWYLKSAKNKDVLGQFNLALSYERGEGCKMNLKKAMYWYRLAAKNGHDEAKIKIMHFQKV